MKTRKQKGAPAESSGRDAQTQTPEKESTHNLTPEPRPRKLAERIKRRHVADWPTRCPHCGEPDPGFVDSDDPTQRVECESCDQASIFGRWVDTAYLHDVVFGLGYDLNWCGGEARVLDRPDDRALRVAATLLPADDAALMDTREIPEHGPLVEAIEAHGLTIRGEG